MYKNLLFLTITFLTISHSIFSQGKAMTPDVYGEWKKIEDTQISRNGNFILYSLTTEVGDETLYVYNTKSGKTISYERSSKPQFSYSGSHLIYTVKPAYDSIRAKKLAGLKKDDLPGDTLTIVDLQSSTSMQFTDVKAHAFPKQWGGYVFLQMDPEKIEKKENREKKDTTAMEDKVKKENKDNGSKLIVIDLLNRELDTLKYVTGYTIAEERKVMSFITTGDDKNMIPGVYLFNFGEDDNINISNGNGKYQNISLSKNGNTLAFLADHDTTDIDVRPLEVYVSKMGLPARKIADNSATFLPEDWIISDNYTPSFSDSGDKVYFGIAPTPIPEDTTLLDEEKPVVEVWSTNQGRMYTQQKVRLKRDQKMTFLVMTDVNGQQIVRLGSEDVPDVLLDTKKSGKHILATTDIPYHKYITWEGSTPEDLYQINPTTGENTLVKKEIQGNIRMSPGGNYGSWYDRKTRHYNTYYMATGEIKTISGKVNFSLADELNDRPMDPYPYGMAGWTNNDEFILVYDRYDIWKLDPRGVKDPVNLTKGRSDKVSYRYIKMDRDEDFIDLTKDLYLYVFDENDKTSGYARLTPGGQLETIVKDKFSYSRRIWKAKNSNDIVYTKENMTTFPNLIHSDLSFQMAKTFTDANPQQAEYRWGDGKLFSWTAFDGKKIEGMVYTPDGFDPGKKYPLLVNFYERSSNGLYRHRAPYAHRSTINYTYYLSKGYVIFNPDVHYDIGYPGQSAYNCVVSGVEALLKEGYIDEARIGVQGHSWGGYQIAHLVTKTDMFACAESGAPVVNMVSAYGGIRWGSGMSRMFQYEKTQSRLGATLWENPDLYLENSPVFNIDKINTPVLILHNDGDTAVPWYQGIEFFVAMKRLDKDAWMLNYNDEPHWPLKWPNRLDFNKRMEQFFDHYLMDQPMPEWMKKGVPALEKEVNLGY